MKKNYKKIISALLTFSLMFPAFTDISTIQAAAKAPKFNKTKISSLPVNKTTTIKINSNGTTLKKVTWKSSKKCVAITKSNKKSAKIKGLKQGKSTITALVKYKQKNKQLSKKLSCKVTVTANSRNTPDSTQSATITPGTVQTAAPAANTQPTATPTAVPTPTPTPGPTNLLSALGKFVKNVGSCVSYSRNGAGAPVADDETTEFIKENYNSLTAENEMKPEAVLGNQPNLIKVSDTNAIEKNNISIPDGYEEANVPKLNFDNIDKLLQYAKENGLRVRYHGLLWHEQTSNWFFREDYNAGKAYVTPEIMDKRIEYYITNVMEHIYSGPYADVVYCLDVVNEYYHMTECICKIKGTESPLDPPELVNRKTKPDTVKCFAEVYQGLIFEDPDDPAHSPVKTEPEYIKKAFACAYGILEKYNKTDSVELVYNDYDTNFEEARNTAVAVANYVNRADALNPEGIKMLSTIGMQCHDKLESENPRWTIASHQASMDAFRAAGLNFQVTEMDLQLRGQTDEDMLQYWCDFVALVIKEAKLGANITGFTWWGLCDKNSWLKDRDADATPLLCGDSINDKKPAYYKVISTAYEHYWD